MLDKLNQSPIVTILLCVLAVIVVLAGGVVTIVKPDTLPFHEYVQDVAILTAALGLGAGVGRGVNAASKQLNTTEITLAPEAEFVPEPSSAPIDGQ